MRSFVYATGILLVLLALYVGAYYALVTRVPVFPETITTWTSYPTLSLAMSGPTAPLPPTPEFPIAPAPTVFSLKSDPAYSFGGKTAEWFFTPWHAVDRWLRSEYWNGW